MAIKRTVILADLTDVQLEFMLDRDPERTLEVLKFEMDLDRPNADPNLLREMWRRHGPALLPRYIRAHPGTRPRCWWSFEAPEMRRPVRGSAEPVAALGFAYGLPRNLADWTPDLHYESQAALLDRHKLLTPGERRRLGADAYAPVRYQHWHERAAYDRLFRTGDAADVLPLHRD